MVTWLQDSSRLSGKPLRRRDCPVSHIGHHRAITLDYWGSTGRDWSSFSLANEEAYSMLSNYKPAGYQDLYDELVALTTKHLNSPSRYSHCQAIQVPPKDPRSAIGWPSQRNKLFCGLCVSTKFTLFRPTKCW